jgi:hypothetical protein
MSPIRDVSLDVLGQIFLTYHHAFYSHSRPEPPWPEVTLSHVCQRWRDIALSSHFKTLWSIIIYDYRRLKDVSRINTYLQRSSPLPIDVTTKVANKLGPEGDKGPTVLSAEILDCLFSEAQLARWRSFTLVASPGENYAELVKRVHAAPAPLLESFSILNILGPNSEANQRDYSVQSLDPQIFVGESRVPKLTSIHLTDVGVQYLRPPLHHVVELSLEGPGGAKLIEWKDLIDVIFQLPTLRKLSIMGDILPGFEEDMPEVLLDPISTTPAIQAPYITQLRYDAGEDDVGEDWTFLSALLPRLSAPNLECLILGEIGEDKSFGDPTPNVVASFPKLKTVVLHAPWFGDVHAPDGGEQWYSWLSRATASSLETLKLIIDDPRENEMLTRDDLWPGIKEFVYSAPPLGDSDSTLEYTMNVVAQFADARPSLTTVYLPSPLPRDAARATCGPLRDAFELLKCQFTLKTFSTLWDVVPEAFVFKTTGWSVSQPECEGGVGELEVGGKSIRSC